MNYGPLVFFVAFLGISASWVGFVLKPHMQVGHQKQSDTVPPLALYPQGRPGLAREGIEVYRANGCAWCHSQQVIQSETICDVVLNQPVTNQAALLTALAKLRPGSNEAQLKEELGKLPAPILKSLT